MWKSIQSPPANSGSKIEAMREIPPSPPAPTAVSTDESKHTQPRMTGLGQAVLSRDLRFKGQITGNDSLYIDGLFEGSIYLPGQRVTIGENGQVLSSISNMHACITAREIVVMGTVTGDITASDRVEVRAEGKMIGDIKTQRISIEDGALFQGAVDLCKPEIVEPEKQKPNEVASEGRRTVPFNSATPAQPEEAKPSSESTPPVSIAASTSA